MHRETDPLSFGLDALQNKCMVLLYTHKWPRVTAALHRADYSAFFVCLFFYKHLPHNQMPRALQLSFCYLHEKKTKQKTLWCSRKGFSEDLQHSKGNLRVPLYQRVPRNTTVSLNRYELFAVNGEVDILAQTVNESAKKAYY